MSWNLSPACGGIRNTREGLFREAPRWKAVSYTHLIKLRDGFCWTGIIDDKLRVFDIVMYTEFGTTYNSYVMKTGDKVVLFETAKARFFDDYLEKLKEVIDVTKIDYLVTSHTEPCLLYTS